MWTSTLLADDRHVAQLPLFPQMTAFQCPEAELSAMPVMPSWVIQPIAKPLAEGRHMKKFSLGQQNKVQIITNTQPTQELMSNDKWLPF